MRRPAGVARSLIQAARPKAAGRIGLGRASLAAMRRDADEVRLVPAVRALVSLLDEVDRYPALYANRAVLRNALRRYEHHWVPLLAAAPPHRRTALVPPLDVEWVWFVHMLCPARYATDSRAMWAHAAPHQPDRVIDHCMLPPRKRAAGLEEARVLWHKLYPEEPFHVTDIIAASPMRENIDGGEDGEDNTSADEPTPAPSRISYNIIAAAERQMAFHYQVAVMPQYRSTAFLKAAVARYTDKYLELHRAYPREKWVPTYDIDVVWHAHMLHPRAYAAYTGAKCGRLLPHDDSMNDRSEGAELGVRWLATRMRWQQMFNEPIARDGGMWRGDVSVEERELRPEIVRTIDHAVRMLPDGELAFTVQDVEQRLAPAETAFVDRVRWVHRTDLESRRPCAGVKGELDTSIERFSVLKLAEEGPAVFRGRVEHALVGCGAQSTGEVGSILEIFGGDLPGSDLVGAHQSLPLASAHDIPRQSARIGSFRLGCFVKHRGTALLLRMGGEDFAILVGTWQGAAPARKGIPGIPGDPSTGLDGEPGKMGTSGVVGTLALRLWILGEGAPEKWICLRLRESSKISRKYTVRLPAVFSGERDDGRTSRGEIKFNLLSGKIEVRDPCLALPAYLISMSAAMLFVRLQPMYRPASASETPEAETMYPAWTISQQKHPMLRGSGGEMVKDKRLDGVGQLRAQTGTAVYIGNIDDVGDPAGTLRKRVAGGCAGCDGCDGCSECGDCAGCGGGGGGCGGCGGGCGGCGGG